MENYGVPRLASLTRDNNFKFFIVIFIFDFYILHFYMSGHSKWHNIQARKGKQDAARSNVFSKFSKKISIAVKMGGGDPEANFSLRLLVDKAKASGMPKDNIERAIKRGTGEIEGAQLEETLYEAYGPGGAAVIVKALTDNKNRTTSDIKHILSENGGSMGGAGSVLWMFEQCGLVIVSSAQFTALSLKKEDVEMKMIEAGADDIWEEEGLVYYKVKLADFKKGLDAIKSLGLEPERSGVEWVAKDKVKVEEEDSARLQKLFAELDENDDVDDYYTNAE